ncbi:MAG: YibE/F family protein [Oscillospiraceae bacterium]|nr:YibE/F family protein [Oscillospiraceae bacterium]
MKRINTKQPLLTMGILLLIFGIFLSLYFYARNPQEQMAETQGSFFEKGTVTQILTDSCEPDEKAQNAYRGEQKLLVEMKSGKFKGKTYMADNAVGIHTDYAPVKEGQKVILNVSTYSDGSVMVTVYGPDRENMIYLILGLFALVTILVGGKTGAQSILGLVLTVLVLLGVFLPLLAKGWSAIPTAFFLCSLVAVACFLILGGCSKKVLCACGGTIGGMVLAMAFGILAQKLLMVDGYQAEYADALHNERITGTPFEIRGLLVAGVIISSLGAVMDVAMSIASAIHELKSVNRQLDGKQLWKSGMNIGRDMVGTMTNTLILAILGSSVILILYIFSMNLSANQFLSSSFLAMEVLSSVASAMGVILAVPLTTALAALLYGKKKQ